MRKLYDEIPEMTFFTGDTLPVFTIKVKNQDIEKCTMKMVISRVKPPKEKIVFFFIFGAKLQKSL